MRSGPTSAPALICRPGAITPPKNSPESETTSKFVLVPKSTTMAGPPNAVNAASVFTTRSAPTSRGLSVTTDTPVFMPGADDHGLVREVGGGHLAEGARHVGYHAGHTEPGDVGAQIDAAMLEEAREQKRELVRGALGLGGGAPRVLELGPVEHAEHDLGVADIGREQHGYPSISR